MAIINDQQIASLVDKIVAELAPAKNISQAKPAPVFTMAPAKTLQIYAQSSRGVFATIEDAIKASEKAFLEYSDVSLATREKIIARIRSLCRDKLKTLAKLAIEETGLGRYEDKIRKNEVAIDKTPGLEDLNPRAFSGDNGLTIIELAPYGVIGAITPCTNPSETIISNTIGMIAGGNSVVFNAHPSAKKTSIFVVDLINEAIISEGGPPNLITTVANPTIESANILMKHPKIGLLVVTGGPAVVAAAMKSGKRVIAAGPGNPPAVVDETADIELAAKNIIQSASTDNNIICVIEKNIIATKAAADTLKKALTNNGAFELNSYQTKRLEKVIVGEDGLPNKKWVGKDIQLILKEIDIDIDPSYRLAIAEADVNHSFAKLELLMPVLPFIRANNIDEAIDMAYKLEDHCFHTATIHSRNIDHLHRMAIKMNTAIFVKNGPALAGLGLGGEGPASFTIAAPTGEGVTTARHFTRNRRCVVTGHFRIV